MSSWQEEYEKRLRRVVGVTDDTVDVVVEGEAVNLWTGCDTCGDYGADVEFIVKVVDYEKGIYKTKTFIDMGYLMQALDEVEIDDN